METLATGLRYIAGEGTLGKIGTHWLLLNLREQALWRRSCGKTVPVATLTGLSGLCLIPNKLRK